MAKKNSKRKRMASSQSSATLNDFQDEILTHIISFLPIKEAFQTSVLSKRWASLCHSLPDLHFDDKDVNKADQRNHFRQMLDTIMFSTRSQDVTLKSFHLKCYSKLWESQAYCFHFNEWIQVATRRHVENLELHLLRIPLSPSIFCCKSLVVMKLYNIRVATMFRRSVHLPFLKTMVLSHVRFEEMEDLMKLLSGCNTLEYLATTSVKAKTGVTDGGYFKPLSKLIKATITFFEGPFRAVSSVQHLIVYGMGDSPPPNVKINSYYKGLPVFGNLTELQLHWSHKAIHDWDEVVKILENCPKLQTLSISKWKDKSATKDWKFLDHIPECVSSHLTTCNITQYQAVKADFRFAKYILQNARLLQVMKIRHARISNPILESPHFLEDLSSYPRISPACKLSLSEMRFGFHM